MKRETYGMTFAESEPDANSERVLPRKLEEEIFDRGEGKPLQRLLSILTEAGVSPEELEELGDCVDAMRSRPSKLNRLEVQPTDWKGLEFSPPSDYFRMNVKLPHESLMPDLLRNTRFKPKILKFSERLVLNEKVRFRELPENVLTQFVREETESKSPENTNEKSGFSAVEWLTAYVNRYHYTYHDAFHIFQQLAVGDGFSEVMDKIGGAEFLNKAKVVEFLKNNRREKLLVAASAEVLENPVIPKPVKDLGPESWARITPFNNEPVLDWLLGEVMGPELLKHPTEMAYLHNTVALGIQALKECRDEVVSSLRGDESPKTLDLNYINSILRIQNTLSMIAIPYLSALPNVEARKKYWEKIAKDPSVNFEVDLFPVTDEKLDVINLFTEITTILQAVGKESLGEAQLYEFPDGMVGIYTQSENVPLHKKEVEVGVELLTAAIVNKVDSNTLRLSLEKLDTLSLTPNSEAMVILNTINETFGTAISLENARFCRSVSKHAVFSEFEVGGSAYPLHAEFRQQLLDNLKQKYPESLRLFLKPLFFKTVFFLSEADLRFISGMGDRDEMFDFENVSENKALGIFDIDVTLLDPNEKIELQQVWGKISEGNSDPENQLEILKILKEIKLRQVKQLESVV